MVFYGLGVSSSLSVPGRSLGPRSSTIVRTFFPLLKEFRVLCDISLAVVLYWRYLTSGPHSLFYLMQIRGPIWPQIRIDAGENNTTVGDRLMLIKETLASKNLRGPRRSTQEVFLSRHLVIQPDFPSVCVTSLATPVCYVLRG